MRTFVEFIREMDRVFAEAMDIKDIKAKVYHAIKAKQTREKASASPDDVWNQSLEIFDDKDEILKDPELADMIRNHPDRGAILRDIQSGRISVGALVQKLADADEEAEEELPKPMPETPAMQGNSQGVMEPGRNDVPIA